MGGHGKGCLFTGQENLNNEQYIKGKEECQVPCSDDLALKETFWCESSSFRTQIVY